MTDQKKSLFARSAKYHRARRIKDRLAHWMIGGGGVLVIIAISLIFFYLLWIVFPLFTPASAEKISEYHLNDAGDGKPIWLSIEEQQEVALRISADGTIRFFEAESGSLIDEAKPDFGQGPLVMASASLGNRSIVLVNSAGEVNVVSHDYSSDFSQGLDNRRIIPSIQFPYGEQPLSRISGGLSDLAVIEDDGELTIAALGQDGKVTLLRGSKQQNLLTGHADIEWEKTDAATVVSALHLGLSSDRMWLYTADAQGNLHRYSMADLELQQTLRISDHPITELTMLAGGISVLAGDSQGNISQAFPVRGENMQVELRKIRSFPKLDAAIRSILPETRRKGFLAMDELGDLAFYHSTAHRRVLDVELGKAPAALAFSARADSLLVESDNGGFSLIEVKNPHPDVSWSNLWGRVWYENYEQPDWVWQSSAANTDFEPKFSLTPLVFGTIRAALYAMLFAIPLALMAAAYSACFLSPALREKVKPAVETMAALPTVVLGFLAGLWFAPFLEKHLAGLIMLAVIVPLGVLVFAWSWERYGGNWKQRVIKGWQPVLLIPVVLALSLFAIWLAGPLQYLFFDGDLRSWLTLNAGIDYDQRNAIVVGCAMGFAVIPTIFSISEDAFYGVPKSLTTGSLALGATSWQTVVQVVLPTASPGVFSALMIGFGRVVGETMIVLMASGNTPIMDMNIFEGMRTLAANIAVEMPESAVNSSHFRVLFLAALVLFVFTFIVNTGAEIVRQRLREKYSSL